MSLPFTQHRRVGDIELAYADSGGPGEAVLLVHGAYLSKETWAAQWSALSAHHRVIAVDLRGHGESTAGIWPFRISRAADDLTRLLDALDIRRAHLCGHSLGGMVALELALQHPVRVRSLALAETSSGIQASAGQAIASHLVRAFLTRVSIRRQAQLYAALLAPGNPAVQQVVRQHVQAFEDRPEAFRDVWDAVMAFSVAAALPLLACPLLVMVGGRNPLTHGQARQLARAVPQSELAIIPGAGHLFPLERPEAFNARTLDFWHRHGP